jgi:glycosyltransferase involved in cell wall biosynthesis
MEGGGVEIQTYNDSVALTKAGFTVSIISSRKSSETRTDTRHTYPFTTADGVTLDICASTDSMTNSIIDADIVHIHATYSMRPAMMSAMKICNQIQKKYFVTLHTNSSHIPFSRLADMPLLEKDIILDDFKRYLSSDLCTIVGVSQSIQASLSDIGITKECCVIYNAKDWNSFFEYENTQISKVDVTYIGEISWMKGMHTLISAITILIEQKPDLKVRIIGNGQDKKQVIALVQALGLETHIEFIEYTENKYVYAYLQNTSLLVQPSLSESWGNIVMEALAAKTAVVVSKTEGLVELVEDGKIGDLFEKGNAADLAKKIQDRLDNPLSTAESDRVSAYITNKYSMQNRLEQMKKLYLAQ